ncbi:hypothetical protein ACLB2K_037824 [Fragaria x ananassa]
MPSSIFERKSSAFTQIPKILDSCRRRQRSPTLSPQASTTTIRARLTNSVFDSDRDRNQHSQKQFKHSTLHTWKYNATKFQINRSLKFTTQARHRVLLRKRIIEDFAGTELHDSTKAPKKAEDSGWPHFPHSPILNPKPQSFRSSKLAQYDAARLAFEHFSGPATTAAPLPVSRPSPSAFPQPSLILIMEAPAPAPALAPRRDRVAEGHPLWLPYLRAFFIYFIGSFIIPDTTTGVVSVHYLSLMDDMQAIGDYAWGAAAWATMHGCLQRRMINGLSYALMIFAIEHIRPLREELIGQVELLMELPLMLSWPPILRKVLNGNTTLKRGRYIAILEYLVEAECIRHPYERLGLAEYGGQLARACSETLCINFLEIYPHTPNNHHTQFGFASIDPASARGLPAVVVPIKRKGPTPNVDLAADERFTAYKDAWLGRRPLRGQLQDDWALPLWMVDDIEELNQHTPPESPPCTTSNATLDDLNPALNGYGTDGSDDHDPDHVYETDDLDPCHGDGHVYVEQVLEQISEGQQEPRLDVANADPAPSNLTTETANTKHSNSHQWLRKKKEAISSGSDMDASMNANAGIGGSGGNGIMVPQTNDTAGTAGVDDPKQDLNKVINSIQKTLGLIHQLYLTVSSFNAGSQLPLLQRLNALITELDNMAKLSDKCNIQIPMEVFNLIDDGKNPDEFTRDVINSCIAKNQITKGKTDTFKSLRKHLLDELEQAFPDEVESYREIRAASAAETKRLAQAQSSLPNGDVKVKPEF